MTRAETEEQRRLLWEAYTSTLTNGLFNLTREFEQKFKVDAILLRDEMLSRLPATERSESISRSMRTRSTHSVFEKLQTISNARPRACVEES